MVWRMDESTVEALIESALAEALDSHARWHNVTALHSRGDEETFLAASQLSGSSEPIERILGADILGQLGAGEGVAVKDRPYRGRCVETLLGHVAAERDPRVLEAIAIAFGHLGDARCAPALHPLRGHPDPEVRHGVASGLLGLDDDLAVETLIQLSQDEAAHVRDWATFGLARQIERDTPDVRDALLARLDDPDEDTRAEALAGLGRRGDARAVDPLIAELEETTEASDPGVLMDALLALATRTRDQRLCRHVRAARDKLERDRVR